MRIIISILLLCFVINGITQIGGIDSTFNHNLQNFEGADSTVNSISIQNDGKIIIGGNFKNYNDTIKNFITRINIDGSIDTSFKSTGANFNIRTTAIQSDNKILIGGDFTSINGINQNFIARLNTDGSIDTSFNKGIGADFFVQTIAIQTDNKIIIGGDFTLYNGIERNRIARLNANGSIDSSFNSGTGPNGSVNAIAIQSNGKIIIGGSFTTYKDTSRSRIARLNADGCLDTTFDLNNGINYNVNAIAIQGNGKILIGGDLNFYYDARKDGIAQLNADGSLDFSFIPSPGPSRYVNTIVLQNDGKILIGGNFSNYNNYAINNIARLNSNGSLDIAFNPGTGSNSFIKTIAIQSDGKILIGGDFTLYNGIVRNHIARILVSEPLSHSNIEKSDYSYNTYPNPFSNELEIVNKNNSKQERFEIFNITGLVVYKGIVEENTVVNTAQFKAGIYFVRFENGRVDKVVKD